LKGGSALFSVSPLSSSDLVSPPNGFLLYFTIPHHLVRLCVVRPYACQFHLHTTGFFFFLGFVLCVSFSFISLLISLFYHPGSPTTLGRFGISQPSLFSSIFFRASPLPRQVEDGSDLSARTPVTDFPFHNTSLGPSSF